MHQTCMKQNMTASGERCWVISFISPSPASSTTSFLIPSGPYPNSTLLPFVSSHIRTVSRNIRLLTTKGMSGYKMGRSKDTPRHFTLGITNVGYDLLHIVFFLPRYLARHHALKGYPAMNNTADHQYSVQNILETNSRLSDCCRKPAQRRVVVCQFCFDKKLSMSCDFQHRLWRLLGQQPATCRPCATTATTPLKMKRRYRLLRLHYVHCPTPSWSVRQYHTTLFKSLDFGTKLSYFLKIKKKTEKYFFCLRKKKL